MTNQGHSSTHHHGAFKGLVIRLYSLGLLIAVTWISYCAFAFLFRSVFSPKLTPDRFTNRPLQLDLATLDGNDPSRMIDDGDTAPLDHYHGVGELSFGRFQTGCLTSGCHTILPHETDKATRALANFHVTFLDCAMCHRNALTKEEGIGWKNVSSGEPQSTPALLLLVSQFQGEELPEGGDKMIELVREAIEAAPPNPVLPHLLLQLETSEPASPMHRHALARLRAVLPSMAKGDYGAIIAPKNNTGYSTNELEPLIEAYFSPKDGGANRRAIQDKIHKNVLVKPRACQQCHDAEPTRIDFAALGYPENRIGPLQNNAIANMVQQIRDGKTFHLPNVLESPTDE
ncbi:MAG TPA: hypothetical protein PKN33_13680 [Phycisphaerae bacterium]|nr:hypothetical protein [Phycisphaerae bacterium]